MLADRDATETMLINLPEESFVAVWREVVGEVPAIIVDRTEMVDILLETAAAAGPDTD